MTTTAALVFSKGNADEEDERYRAMGSATPGTRILSGWQIP